MYSEAEKQAAAARVPDVFYWFAQLHGLLALPNMKQATEPIVIEVLSDLPGCKWTIATFREAVEVNPNGCMGVTLRPFELAIWWNGWLAGFVGLNSRVIAAGEGANEERLVADMHRLCETIEGNAEPDEGDQEGN